MSKNKVLVAGSRTFKNFTLLKDKLDLYLSKLSNIEIVQGEAKGADTLAYTYAYQKNIPCKGFPAPWDAIEGKPEKEIGMRRDGVKYWKKAGPFRNEQMAQYVGEGGYAVIFWNGKSSGTKDMIERCKKHKIKNKIVLYE